MCMNEHCDTPPYLHKPTPTHLRPVHFPRLVDHLLCPLPLRHGGRDLAGGGLGGLQALDQGHVWGVYKMRRYISRHMYIYILCDQTRTAEDVLGGVGEAGEQIVLQRHKLQLIPLMIVWERIRCG